MLKKKIILLILENDSSDELLLFNIKVGLLVINLHAEKKTLTSTIVNYFCGNHADQRFFQFEITWCDMV